MDYVEGCSFKELMRSPESVPVSASANRHRCPQKVYTPPTDYRTRLGGETTCGSYIAMSRPENMLVGVGWYLSPYGFWAWLAKADRALGATTRGKPGYVSPEQIGGSITRIHRADIFSMGVVLWAALTGKRLFTGEDSGRNTPAGYATSQYPPPSTLGAQSTPTLDAIILRACVARVQRSFRFS